MKKHWYFRESQGSQLESSEVWCITDLILDFFDATTTETYLKFIETHSNILNRLEEAIVRDTKMAQVYVIPK